MLDKILHKNLKIPYLLNFQTLRSGRQSKGTIIFLHGIASFLGVWKDAINEIGDNFDILTVDLIGHGHSPSPEWHGSQTLSAQARAVARTMLHTRSIKKPIFIVGHSMGSLVAVEFAKKYPFLVNQIILLSPPIYREKPSKQIAQERLLKKGYQDIVENPEKSFDFVNLVIKMGLVDVKPIKDTKYFDNLRESLQTAIVEQDTYAVLSKIKTRTKIIYGALDPVVIGRTIRNLGRKNLNITTTRVLASHDPTKTMIKEAHKSINKFIKEKNG